MTNAIDYSAEETRIIGRLRAGYLSPQEIVDFVDDLVDDWSVDPEAWGASLRDALAVFDSAREALITSMGAEKAARRIVKTWRESVSED